MRTTTAKAPALEEYIRLHHTLETPDIVVTSIVGGDAEYLKWIDGHVAPATATHSGLR
ncbi:divalent cation tolerance protein CutA [Nonomuraea guangzhouensis]|uniref:Divalent cation tolerance protein CutA n=1 Tax=Nonomuraea guangzhouensis TaxID=1291555 RepID=A0ABW4GVL9_9ACTN